MIVDFSTCDPSYQAKMIFLLRVALKENINLSNKNAVCDVGPDGETFLKIWDQAWKLSIPATKDASITNVEISLIGTVKHPGEIFRGRYADLISSYGTLKMLIRQIRKEIIAELEAKA